MDVPTDRWINGATITELAPLVYGRVRTQIANRRCVRDALWMQAWMDNISGELDTDGLAQFIRLWEILLDVQLAPNMKDKPVWN